MRQKNHALMSEVAELEAILARIPVSNVIERAGFEQRLKSARARLGQAADVFEPERTRLTFRGLPVVGSKGISAEFGSKAVVGFSDAFSAIIAGMKNPLNYMGPVPDKSHHQLLITGTAVGSFGFEFELPNLPANFFSESGGAEEALDKFINLLKLSAEEDDDLVTEVVASVHPRAVRKVTSFLSYLYRNQAWCGLEFKHGVFRYRNIEQLRRSRDRLSQNNIREDAVTYRGHIQGVLPKGRTFEFQAFDETGILRGKVGLGIEDPDVLNRNWLHKPVEITLDFVQVGQGRPNYTLGNLKHIRLLSQS
ncbi:hypothetical protein [Brucella pseudogrignonensis]|uniref:Uncharacterized protein n=1 Tax=Brucella pseudogrignonensis TaxID=419475 RepID=A0A7Y3T669_9HYPH|nr:hypothetical protein [Brucella pseudogrignonensis]NNV21742.1 hypothetical protein [Brucella pseudogrignonensis]